MPKFALETFSVIVAVFFASCSTLIGQKNVVLDQIFYSYDKVEIQTESMYGLARSGDFFQIDVPLKNGKIVTVELHDSKIIADHYVSQYVDDEGLHYGDRPAVQPTKGHIVGDLSSSVSLTIGEDFLYGFVRDSKGYTYIEPISYLDNTVRTTGEYVIYTTEDLRPTAPHTCGATEMHGQHSEMEARVETTQGSRVGECFIVEWAIANDFLMYENFNSNIGTTEAHAIGVANNVQTNYDDEFADEIQFQIVTQFTATTAATDPWTSSTDASTLLNDFTNWGPSGFGTIHDVGSIWTDRNFAGSTIGIAWLNAICTSIRYNALQNWSTNASLKRVMVAHELGHNFNANHDASGSGDIMAPSVNNTTTWSSNSITRINAHIASRTCLDNCAGSNAPPVAGFDFTIIDDCTPGSVVFTNTTVGNVTDYFWEFEGGSPLTSTQQNPSVTYINSGVFDVTLTVTNSAGDDEIIQNNIIEINDSPQVEFGYAINGTVVSFFNFSEFTDFYEWDFGDGSTSEMSDPVHDYLDDGVYTVTLTGSSACGDDIIQEIIVVANPPTAAFTADVEEGCASFTVQYTSQSSNNTDDFLWVFEGGIPGTSNLENPSVEYTTPGEFDVSLTVLNETGDDVLLRTDFISVTGVPQADFSYTVSGNEVLFENQGLYGTSFIWTFGDGEASTDESPSHTYTSDGTYTVTLTSENECGSNSISQTVTISLAPIPSFNIAGDQEGCAPFSVDYQSTSTNSPDTYEWIFEGGTPTTSADAQPSVVYTEAGVYDVTLTVANGNGSNTETFTDYITVGDNPISGFTFNTNGLEVTFFDGSDDADTYSWSFGDGQSSTVQNPIHTFLAEGIYTVTQTVTNDCGTSSESVSINTYTPVSAGLSSDITAGCADLEVQFEDMSSANVTSWAWTFAGGTPATSTDQNPTVTYATAGQYDVVLTVSHPESTESITLTNYVAVSDVPVTSFEFFDDLFEVDFTNTTVEGDTYLWDFGDGNSSTMESPTHTYAAEGTYEVILVATNSCGATTAAETVIINALPTAGFNSDNSEGCGPLTVSFSNASSSNVDSYAWTFEGGTPAISTAENPSVTYSAAGTYDVTLMVTSEAGTDVLTLTDYVIVNSAPTADLTLSSDGITITGINTGAGGDNTWTVDGQTFDTDALSYAVTENGIYEVTLTTVNECGEASETAEVEISVFPEVAYSNLPITACVDELIILADNSTNVVDRVWTLSGATPGTSTAATPEIAYSAVGTYDIELTVSNDFGTSTEIFTNAVTIIDVPVASFTGDQQGNTVDFLSTIDGGTTFSWDFGDGGTSTDKDPTHIYTKNGTYTATLTVTNDCGTVTVTEDYTIISNAVTERELAAMKMYPNPASDIVTISIANVDSDLIQLSVVDVQGRVALSQSFAGQQIVINTSTLVPGTYLVRVQSDEAIAMRKLVIVR